MNQQTITGSTDRNGLFTAENPYSYNSDVEYMRSLNYRCNYDAFAEVHPPLFCYNENNELVKGVEGLDVKEEWQIFEESSGGFWTSNCKQDFNSYASFLKYYSDVQARRVYIAVQPTEKAVEYTYTIDGKPCTEKQYHDTEYASNLIDVGYAEKHHTPLPEAQPLEGVKTASDTLTIIELAESAEQMAERYASWFGIYNDPEWDKLRLAYLAGERFGRLKIQGQVISTNELRDLADKHCYLTDFDKYKDSPLELARYTYERSFRDSEAYHSQFATDAGGGKDHVIAKAKREYETGKIGFVQALEQVFEAAAPSAHSSSEMVERLSILIETIKGFEITGDVEVDEDLYNQGLERAVKEINKLITQILTIKR